MKNIILAFLLFILFFTLGPVLSASKVSAQLANPDPIPTGECDEVGKCIDNYKCVLVYRKKDPSDKTVSVFIEKSTEVNCNSTRIGGVDLPAGMRQYNLNAGGTPEEGEGIGIIIFISNLLKVFTIVCGIWAMFNFVMGGYTYITSMSDPGAHEKVKNSITMTVIGLAIIASAYTIAGVVGLLMFGDAGFILNPQLYSALK